MSEELSRRQFADRIGVSHVWVGKLVRQGKIPLTDNNKIPWDEGYQAYLDSQQLGYEGNREYNASQRRRSKKSQADADGVDLPEDDAEIPASAGTSSGNKVMEAFNRARLAEKTYQAKLKELNYKEKQGDLIPRESVEADAADTAEKLRGLLFAIPPRIAPLCEGQSARKIESIIEQHINRALQALKKSRFHTEPEQEE